MSKIIQPFGTLQKEIVIKTDEKGLTIVEAWEYVLEVKRGFRPQAVKKPMDSRHMVLALQKISFDYCAVIFQGLQGLTPVPPEGQSKTNGQEDRNNDKTV